MQNGFQRARQLVTDIGGIEHSETLEQHPVGHLVMETALSLADTEEQLADQSRMLESRMQRLRGSIASGQHVNGLGEVQGSGLDVDRLCVQRQSQIEQLKKIAAAYKKLQENQA